MANGGSSLEEMIGALTKLGGRGLVAELAKEAAPGVQAALQKTARAGQSPDGQAWAPKKDGGGAPMVNAAAHVATTATGGVIRTTLTGPDVWHQIGSRGQPRRAVIPDRSDDIPEGVGKALDEAAGRVFARVMGGGRG